MPRPEKEILLNDDQPDFNDDEDSYETPEQKRYREYHKKYSRSQWIVLIIFGVSFFGLFGTSSAITSIVEINQCSFFNTKFNTFIHFLTMIGPLFPALYFIHLFGPLKPKFAFVLDVILCIGVVVMVFTLLCTFVLMGIYPSSVKDVNRFDRTETELKVCFLSLFSFIFF